MPKSQFLFPVPLQYFADDFGGGGVPAGDAGAGAAPDAGGQAAVTAPADGGQAAGVPDQGQGGGQPPAQQQQQQPAGNDSAFARMRRAMEQQFQNSHEYRLAQKIAERYNMTPDQLLSQLEQAEMQARAQQYQVAPEFLKDYQAQQQRIDQLEQHIARQRVQSEIAQFKANPLYQKVTEEELGAALSFLGQMHRSGLNDFTLEQAFRATNPNFEAYLRENIRQQVIQEYAQNGQAPLPPHGGAAPKPSKSAFDLPEDKFDELVKRVKSGDRITQF